ncbi:hypothetical protein SPFM9_00226 [Salmonella phage SPFM9]|nr:hypothetical protein SPFM9_00226 [Salmonella phage SPFM9]
MKDLAIEDKGGLGYHLFLHCVASTLDKTVAVIYTADGVQSNWDRLVKVLPQSGEVQLDFVIQTVLDIDAYEAANFTKPTKLVSNLKENIAMKAIHTFRMTGLN